MLVGESEDAIAMQKQKSPTIKHASDEEMKEACPSSPAKAKLDTVPRNIKLPQSKCNLEVVFVWALARGAGKP